MIELLWHKKSKMITRKLKTTFSTVALLSLAVLSSGCSGKSYSDELKEIDKEPVAIPYAFKVDSFLDRRPNQGAETLTDVLSPRQVYPFKQNSFLQALVNNINGNAMFEYEPATLRVELKDYAAFKDGIHYTTSFYVDVTGFDENGRVLATGVFSCFAKENISVRAVSGLKTFFLGNDQDVKEEGPKISDTWRDLYGQCLNDIAYDFNAKIIEWHQRRG